MPTKGEAVEIYGFLREAWERALEEVLLGGVVERFRSSVQTRQVASLADISNDDCKGGHVCDDEMLKMAARTRRRTGCTGRSARACGA